MKILVEAYRELEASWRKRIGWPRLLSDSQRSQSIHDETSMYQHQMLLSIRDLAHELIEIRAYNEKSVLSIMVLAAKCHYSNHWRRYKLFRGKLDKDAREFTEEKLLEPEVKKSSLAKPKKRQTAS